MNDHRLGTGLRFWLITLSLLIAWGGRGYGRQLRAGLAVTGLSDAILWGLYIGNFTFLVGLAASVVILLFLAHILRRPGMEGVLLLGEAVAVTAVTLSLLFVFVDLGQPLRFWHALPLLGSLNFPRSIMAWDLVVLVLYLLASVLFGLRLSKNDRRSSGQAIGLWIGLLLILGLSIHTVTAFLLAAQPARPLWHDAMLAPHFLVSAFASGAGFLLLLLALLERLRLFTRLDRVIDDLGGVLRASLLTDLFLLAVDCFVLFYRPTEATRAARWLYLMPDNFFTAWIGVAWGAIVTALLLLLLPGRRRPVLLLAAALCCVGVWMEKGLGLVVPGFVPTPLGEIAGYLPSSTEIQVATGIWAMGATLLTFLVRAITRTVHAGYTAGQNTTAINTEDR
ncbi:MAG: polysulfide reductase NrfD [Magnetococcales bacterium]|nr:polysulfide reductase NrfD [Magnetococcales bacterium]